MKCSLKEPDTWTWKRQVAKNEVRKYFFVWQFTNILQSGSATGMMLDHLPTPTNDKHVHADFYNDFEDLFDDDDNTLARPRGTNDIGRQ